MKPVIAPALTLAAVLAGAFRCVGCQRQQGAAHAAGCAFAGLTARSTVHGG